MFTYAPTFITMDYDQDTGKAGVRALGRLEIL